MNVTLWASSSRDAIRRLEAYLGKYNWTLLSTDRAITVDPLHDYEDAVNELIAHTLQNRNFIGLGTYFTYPPN